MMWFVEYGFLSLLYCESAIVEEAGLPKGEMNKAFPTL